MAKPKTIPEDPDDLIEWERHERRAIDTDKLAAGDRRYLLHLTLSGEAGEALNDRLNTYCAQLNFPTEAIRGNFEIEESGGDLHFRFSVNGKREEYVYRNCRRRVSGDDLQRLCFLPWEFFLEGLALLDSGRRMWNLKDDVRATPLNMQRIPPGARHDITGIGFLYSPLLDAWQHGKKVKTKNQSFEDCRETVKRAVKKKLAEAPLYLDLLKSDIFDELLDRLIGKEFTEEKQAKLGERALPSPPAEIALDHAVFLCGVNPYAYSPRQLRSYTRGNFRRFLSNPKNSKNCWAVERWRT